MLALLSRGYFRSCLLEIKVDVRPEDRTESFYGLAGQCRELGRRYHVEAYPADIARTAIYLADLKERLRLYREAHPPAANRVGPDCDHHVSAWTEANGDAAILADFD